MTASPWNLSIVPPCSTTTSAIAREVPADDLGDLARRQALGDRGEAADVAEQDRDLELLLGPIAPARAEVLGDLRGTNERSVAAMAGLLDDRRVQALHLVDRRWRSPVRRRHAAEQLGDAAVDGLLRRAERGGHLLRSRAPATSCRGARDPRSAVSPRPESRSAIVGIDGAAAGARPRGSRARARRPARCGPSAGTRGRSAPARAARSRTPRRRARRAPRRRCRGGRPGSRARSRCPRAGSSGGILMSVTTTSGMCSAAVASSEGASSATPTTSMSS